MENNFKDDTFLAEWISDKLTSAELEAFKSHPDYEAYRKIKKASQELSFSEYDVDKALHNLKQNIPSKPIAVKKNKVKSLYSWIGAVAASVVLIFGFLFFKSTPKEYSTTVGEQSLVSLPDGSEMYLNANATAFVNKKKWKTNRAVKLEGEAFFKVKKGKKFNVITSLGTVEVLGTQFTVNTIGKDVFIVKCFEGKVKIRANSHTEILTKGMSSSIINGVVTNKQFISNTPSWLAKNETEFVEMPLTHVISLLKRHYNLIIENEQILNGKAAFTGSFINNNLKKALYAVFETSGVSYKLELPNKVVLLNK